MLSPSLAHCVTFESFCTTVPIEEIESQAYKQARLRIPHRWESPEYSATYTGKGYVRRAMREGFIRVDMPLSMLEISEDDLALERLARLELLGGTEDPIWVYIDRDMETGTALYSVMDGNNRCQYRKQRNVERIPAFVTGKVYEYRVLYDQLLKQGYR